MNTPAARQLTAFVDRTDILRSVDQMLEGASPVRVLWIHGPSGIGKTMLLSEIARRLAERGADSLYLGWRDSQRPTYLDLMRRLRDFTGRPELYALFHDRLNQVTDRKYQAVIKLDPGRVENVSVLDHGEVVQSGVTVHVGNSVQINDLAVNFFVSGSDTDELGIRYELTQAFAPCLAAALASRGAVALFDAVEKADELTLDWIVSEMVERIYHGELPMRLVVAGHQPPSCCDAPRYFDFLRVVRMKPFGAGEIEEYLQVRGVEESAVRVHLARFILANSDGGLPLEVAKSLNNYLRSLRSDD